MGIVLALVVTTLPLILLLVYLVAKRQIKLNLWQILAVSGPLLAFLVVGLVASVKVGGGTNLHNMDMFLVTLVFVAALAWEAGIGERLGALLRTSPVMQALLALIVLVPAFSSLLNARPLALPPQDKTDLALFAAREYVSCAQQYGEVLFMDQRQLLTFGFVENVPLVPEYEKKLVMDEALSGDATYFETFYADLASHRFALIISDRQAIREKESGESLAEENNAWVQWVTEPLFQEYESVENFKLVGMELFMPLGREYTCP
jgi:hypothetical protein